MFIGSGGLIGGLIISSILCIASTVAFLSALADGLVPLLRLSVAGAKLLIAD